MWLLPSKNKSWSFTADPATAVHLMGWRSLHSMTSSLLGSVRVTAQKAFWLVPTGKRSSHHGATKVVARKVGMDALENSVNRPVKFTFPLLLTKRFVKLTPPKRIGNGEVIDTEKSSLKLRLVPVIVL